MLPVLGESTANRYTEKFEGLLEPRHEMELHVFAYVSPLNG